MQHAVRRFALAVVLCAAPVLARAAETVSVGITNNVADIGNFVADKRGYFAAENIQLRLVSFDAAALMIAPLGTGELDVGGGGVAAGLFNAAARGINLKIIADKSSSPPGQGSGALIIRQDLVDTSQYRSLADLKGRKLVIPTQGSATSTALDRLFATAGFSLKDMDVTTMSFPSMVTALQNKAVDAAFMVEPGIETVLDSHTGKVIEWDDQMFPDHDIAVTLGSEHFIHARRAVAVRYMRAFLRGTRDYLATVKDGHLTGPGSDAIIAILTEYSLVKNPAIYRRVRVPVCDPDGRVNLPSLEADLAYFKAHGLVPGTIRVADVVDTSIAEQAVQDIGPYKAEP
jgi:NitT/TauT family transport system substrate-binding protein